MNLNRLPDILKSRPELLPDGRILWVVREGDWFFSHEFDSGFLASFEMEVKDVNNIPVTVSYILALIESMRSLSRDLKYFTLAESLNDLSYYLKNITVDFVRYSLFVLRSAIAV